MGVASDYIPNPDFAIAINPSKDVIIPQGFHFDVTVPAHKRMAPLHNKSGYGDLLKQNKAKLLAAAAGAGASHDQQILLLSMANMETNTLSIGERDSSKDNDPHGSENVGIFNANIDFIARVEGRDWKAMSRGEIARYNSDAGLVDLIQIILAATNKGPPFFGRPGTFNYIRGGYDCAMNPALYDGPGYRSALYAVINYFEHSSAMMRNEYRVALRVKYQK